MRESRARTMLTALAALLCFVLSYGSVFAQVAEPKASPSAPDIEQAKSSMAAGVSFMQDPDGAQYEEAYPAFRKAYILSGSLNALHNLAICAQKLELDGEAIAYYDRVLEKKGDDLDPNDKSQIERDLAALKATVAWITFSADKGQTTLIDERTPRRGAVVRNKYEIGIQNKKFGIHPGQHKFTAQTEGSPDQTWNVEVTSGGKFNHEFVFDKNAPVTADGFTDEDHGKQPTEDAADAADDGGIPVYVWIAGGVTLAAAIPMAIFMGKSASDKADYDDNIKGKAPVAEQEDAASSLETTNLLADIFLGVTAAGAATTVILLVVAMSADGDESASKTDTRFGVDYTITPMMDHRGSAGAVFTAAF